MTFCMHGNTFTLPLTITHCTYVLKSAKLDEAGPDGWLHSLIGPRHANLVLIAYASSEGSGEPAHPRSLARTFAARSYKQ